MQAWVEKKCQENVREVARRRVNIREIGLGAQSPRYKRARHMPWLSERLQNRICVSTMYREVWANGLCVIGAGQAGGEVWAAHVG